MFVICLLLVEVCNFGPKDGPPVAFRLGPSRLLFEVSPEPLSCALTRLLLGDEVRILCRASLLEL